MSQHPVDNFFKAKLANVTIEPSADVWGKIEHHLEDKREPWGLYLSIAASFTIVLAIFSYVLIKPQGSTPVEQQYFRDIEKQNNYTNSSRPKSVQPSGTVPGSENSIPVMAQEDSMQTIIKHTNLHKKTALADYSGDESELRENELLDIEPIELDEPKTNKRKFGISIANSNKYLKEEAADDRYGDKLRGYTAAQWDNITNRKSLNAPPLPNVKFPKFKFEKNPKTDE